MYPLESGRNTSTFPVTSPLQYKIPQTQAMSTTYQRLFREQEVMIFINDSILPSPMLVFLRLDGLEVGEGWSVMGYDV